MKSTCVTVTCENTSLRKHSLKDSTSGSGGGSGTKTRKLFSDSKLNSVVNEMADELPVIVRTRLFSTSSPPDDVVKCGYLRKVKGSRKFFVLRREVDADHPARLEYYVNDKLFSAGKPPRK